MLANLEAPQTQPAPKVQVCELCSTALRNPKKILGFVTVAVSDEAGKPFVRAHLVCALTALESIKTPCNAQ